MIYDGGASCKCPPDRRPPSRTERPTITLLTHTTRRRPRRWRRRRCVRKVATNVRKTLFGTKRTKSVVLASEPRTHESSTVRLNRVEFGPRRARTHADVRIILDRGIYVSCTKLPRRVRTRSLSVVSCVGGKGRTRNRFQTPNA